MRINILHHRNKRARRIADCLITQLAERWTQEGFIVNHLHGCDEHVPADVLISHVDLSCVPDEYLQFASKFPTVINEGLTDIRKRTISPNIVAKTDTYDGAVIVKSDLNSGGAPERQVGLIRRKAGFSILRKIKKRLKIKDPSSIRKAMDYIVYSEKSKVPNWVFDDDSLVVEKFLPEKHGNEYYQRRYYFLGDAEYNEVHATSVAIHAGDSDDHCLRYWEESSIPEALRTYRKNIKADYGKIDYVIRDGEVIVFDVNRTPSCGNAATNSYEAEWAQAIVERLHLGITSHAQASPTQPV